jgi:hypothetical protein
VPQDCLAQSVGHDTVDADVEERRDFSDDHLDPRARERHRARAARDGPRAVADAHGIAGPVAGLRQAVQHGAFVHRLAVVLGHGLAGFVGFSAVDRRQAQVRGGAVARSQAVVAEAVELVAQAGLGVQHVREHVRLQRVQDEDQHVPVP